MLFEKLAPSMLSLRETASTSTTSTSTPLWMLMLHIYLRAKSCKSEVQAWRVLFTNTLVIDGETPHWM